MGGGGEAVSNQKKVGVKLRKGCTRMGGAGEWGAAGMGGGVMGVEERRSGEQSI